MLKFDIEYCLIYVKIRFYEMINNIGFSNRKY
jgi:hypothetical protein